MGFLLEATVFQGAVWIAGPGSQEVTIVDGSKPVPEAAAVVVTYSSQD